MLFFEEAGNPDGEPAVLVHGYMSSNTQWDLNRVRLGRTLRLIMVEQPGHGRSAAPDDPEAYGPDHVLAQLEALRTELGLERWWAIGHSLGGAMMIRYALAHPDSLNGLIFSNSRAAFGLVAPNRAAEDDDTARDAANATSAGPRPPVIGRNPTPEQLRAMPFHPIHAKRFPPDLRDRLVQGVDAMSPHVFAHIAANRRRWRSRDDLHRLTVPTLLINGRWEKLFQPCVALAQAAVDHLSVVELEGGHSINIEQPEAFDEAVLAFIERESRPTL